MNSTALALRTFIEAIVWPATVIGMTIALLAFARSLADRLLEARHKPMPEMPQFHRYEITADTVLAAARFTAAIVAMRSLKARNASIRQVDEDELYDFNRIDKLLRRFIRTATDSQMLQQLRKLSILWAHRYDAHDQFEKRTFVSLGVQVKFVYSNEEAVREYQTGNYNVVVSNMAHYLDIARSEFDDEAGIKLIDRVSPLGAACILYSRSLNKDRIALAQERNVPATGEPEKLFEYVLSIATSEDVTREVLLPPAAVPTAEAK